MKNMDRAMANDIATSLYSDGTGSGGQELGGLQLLVDEDPTSAGTVGSINQATQAFWRNYTSGDVTLSSSTIQSEMKEAWLNIMRGTDVPNLILADDVLFTYYWDSLSSDQQITKVKNADTIEAASLMFQSCPVVFDDQCPASKMYMLNLDHLQFAYAPGRLFQVEDARKVTNANYDVIPAFFAGNLICSRCASQGVIYT